MTIGIVSWSRTNSADFDNFRSKTGATFSNPTEVVPTAYGGIDPGPALTSPPSGSSSTLGGQEEATLDVLRAGSVAPAATLLLVVSSPSGANDGIGADAQYLVNTKPVPAQVMNISFGACESSAGAGGVAFWDGLFQIAAGRGHLGLRLLRRLRRRWMRYRVLRATQLTQGQQPQLHLLLKLRHVRRRHGVC